MRIVTLASARVYDVSVSESDLISAMDANSVTASIVHPFPRRHRILVKRTTE